MAQRHSPHTDNDETYQTHPENIIVPAELIPIAHSFEKKGCLWIATSQVPSDLTVQVEDITFYLHKYPLLPKSGYLQRMELQPSISTNGYELKLENFPGGAETFETVSKFCYGFPVSLNPRNAAALRCASEFLEMTDELEDENLISKAESFLTLVVYSSWKYSITALKSCETLSPWAENLQIVQRCCNSVAWASQGNLTSTETTNEENQWLCNVATLRIDHFMRIATAMRLKGLRPELLGLCIMIYAEKWLLDLDNNVEIEGLRKIDRKNELKWSIQQGRRQEKGTGQNQEQHTIIESLVSILPPQKEVISCKFLFWILKIAMIYEVSPVLISELEKRAGMVLENASLCDLLIPSNLSGEQGKPLKTTEVQPMYNVDVVRRILEYFLMHEQQQQTQSHKIIIISKLLDNYLAEIAGDPNLLSKKFQVIAESLPANARTCDDGLYRAVDIYLKTHPFMEEHDRRILCRVMDCRKLSHDACTHAAQNDRLPLRTVMQVLFSEQVKLRARVHGKEQAANCDDSGHEDSCASTKEDIKLLKVEVEKMKVLIKEVQREYLELQRDCENINKKQSALSGLIIGWRKIKKSTLFHGKPDVNKNIQGKQRDNRSDPRRRRSIS